MRMPAKVSARRGEANTTRPDPRAMEAFSRLRKQITKLETLAQMLDRSYEQMLCRHMSMDINSSNTSASPKRRSANTTTS
mmetsp:Transcript_30968/g.73587  ORF Transcript_30968/g.73587 Transcript_30968/m.73587 type:complete len:80 (-) Transcript_30968:164-403(-)